MLLGPILPPGNGSEQASGHVTDNTVLLAMATPVLLLVVLYFGYAVIVFRQPQGGTLEGPAVRGNARVQTTWIVITSIARADARDLRDGALLEEDGAGCGRRPDRRSSCRRATSCRCR